MILNNILNKAADKYPNERAFTMKMGYRTKSFTYSQVLELSQKAALFFEELDLESGDKLAIVAPNSPYWGVIYWACLLSGIILVPINIQSTDEIIDKILTQTKAKVVFKSKFLNFNISPDIKFFDIEFLEDHLKFFDPRNFIEKEIKQDHLVQILYTSGTTGEPKGVKLTHKNIYSNLNAIKEVFNLSQARERLLSVLPLSHIFEQTVGFFFPQLYASEIIYSHSYSAIFDLLKKHKITKILVVPEFLKIFMQKIKNEYSKKKLIKLFDVLVKFSLKINNKFVAKLLFYPVHKGMGNKLDTIASGGAFLDQELEKTWQALGFSVLQGYGLTETSPLITCNSYKEKKVGSVGKVIKNIELKFDEDGQILVKGPGVFSGYYKNKEETEESFTKNGFFKTGDVGELDQDGFLFLKGRKKYMILGPEGQNIFPEDIEQKLNKELEIKDSCVLGIPNGRTQIHAVLILQNSAVDASQAINNVNKKLASYQKINDFTIWDLDDFPRTPTGKIKKNEVLEFITSKDKDKSKYKKQEPILKILSQISGIPIDKISMDKKTLSDLNLDSLMTVELVLRIEEKFGVLIDESLIASDVKIKELKRVIESGGGTAKKYKLKKWPRSIWARIIRAMGRVVLTLISKIFFRLKIEGLENLKNINTPVIFMPNHLSYADSLVVLMALPYRFKKKLSFAAAQDVLYVEYKNYSWLTELFFNTFPFPRKREENTKQGLDKMGRLLDSNYSVVVFPEGKMSKTGEMLSLKKGAGLMAVEMEVPIIPIKITGTAKVVPYAKLMPRRIGKVTIQIGKPLFFSKIDDYEYTRNKIESAIKSL